jgi:hypothetical protein
MENSMTMNDKFSEEEIWFNHKECLLGVWESLKDVISLQSIVKRAIYLKHI